VKPQAGDDLYAGAGTTVLNHGSSIVMIHTVHGNEFGSTGDRSAYAVCDQREN
jgi:hypothetical protein